jgi:hypothetical protein
MKESQEMQENLKTLIILHIPKTAGITLQNIAIRHYNQDEVVFLYHDETINNFKKYPSKKNVRLLMGHFRVIHGVHQLLKQPYTYVTVLRNPIEQVISHYYYMLHSDDPRHEEIKQDYKSLEEFAQCGWAFNFQTLFISGIPQKELYKNPNEVLELAKKNLNKHFEVVGITERFDELLILLKNKFSWQHIHYQKYNVGNKRPTFADVSNKTLELIRKNNELDMELYAYAEAIFERQIEKVPNFEMKAALFKTTNKYYQKYYSIINGLSKTNNLFAKRFSNLFNRISR